MAKTHHAWLLFPYQSPTLLEIAGELENRLDVLQSCFSIFQAVESSSPAFEAGLRAGHLITHVNNENVQGLLHVQVVSLILSGGSRVTIRAVPLESTSIKEGGRKRQPHVGEYARKLFRCGNFARHPISMTPLVSFICP